MLGLPRSTEVNRPVAKEKLYANAALTPSVRNIIKDQIKAIVWKNKLAESTVSVASGNTVKEIQVFEVQLRGRSLDRKALSAIAKAIPYKILFLLTFEQEVQACIEASGAFYNTDWLTFDSISLKFEGLNLDAMYESLARQVSGGRLNTKCGIAEAVERDRQRKRLERDIAALEKNIQREKQFNRQVELNGKLKRLKAELEVLE